MKRVLLVAAIAVAVLGLLAAPAFAAGPRLPVFRFDAETAYVIAYGDGTWFELTGDREAPEPTWHDPGDPIPANYDVVMQLSWKGVGYGLVKSLPHAYCPKVSILKDDIYVVDMSYEDAKQYWMGVSLWDDYMINLTWSIDPFNPHIGAQVYANRWFPMLTGEQGIATNLDAENHLPEGEYTVYYSEKFVRTYIGRDLLTDEDGEPLNRAPYRITPEGEWVNDPYTFVIGPPVIGPPEL